MSKAPLGFPHEDVVVRRLVVGQRRPWIGAFCVYLTIMMVGVPLYQLPEAKDKETVQGLWLLAGFMAVFISPAALLGWHCLTRRVEIQRTTRNLVIVRRWFGLPWRKRYLLTDIRNLRPYGPMKNSAYSKKFELLFDYHGITIPVVKRLTLAKVNHLIEQLVA